MIATNKEIIINDLVLIFFFTTVNALFIELQFPGFVSVLVDITSLSIILVLVLFLSLLHKARLSYTSFQKFVIIVGGMLTALNAYRLFALQAPVGLVGLATSIGLLGLLLAVIYIVYDRRSQD